MKTMIITGGSSGIGRATAEYFADKGYKVYELSRHGVDHVGIRHIDCDVTNPIDCSAAIEQVIDEQGVIDVLISNAGMGISGAVEFTSQKELHRIMDVNFFGAVNISQAVLPYMRKERSGIIIFVSSLMAVFAIPFQAFYSASKFAINGYAMALRNEMAPFNVKVSCMLPGDVKTGFTGAREKNEKGTIEYPALLKAVKTMEDDEQNGMKPEDIAKTIFKMAEASCPMAMYTTGFKYHLFLLLNKLVPQTLAYKIISLMY
ncbi:MAG: SDR family oxidoreductase [Prevotella sp.]|nr:SDR family oxidoreductase [Prevotella sp.]